MSIYNNLYISEYLVKKNQFSTYMNNLYTIHIMFNWYFPFLFTNQIIKNTETFSFVYGLWYLNTHFLYCMSIYLDKFNC